ncbi:MAG: hypothetical protein ACT4O4_13185 [Nitrospiraceae bacterium]
MRSQHDVLLELMVGGYDEGLLSKPGAHTIVPMAPTNIAILKDLSKGDHQPAALRGGDRPRLAAQL